ncbi:MAG: efflux RND transporter periplasmic adaptor subunit [Anaerolineales bacterium]|nr:efflux RND transporter periplasmic adaptor subunit [Anaerolineales bacterium]
MFKKSKLFSLFILSIIVVALAACQNQGTGEAAPGSGETAAATAPTVDVNEISVNTGVGVVSAEGQVVPLRAANLSFSLGGTVAEILVESGQDVQDGEPLIKLEATALENAVAQAEAGVKAAGANKAAAEANLAVAESGIARAQAGVTAAEAQLALVKAGAREQEIAAAESNLAAAEGGVTQAAGNRDAAVNVSSAAVSAAEARVAAAQAEAQALEEAYQDILDACFETPDGGEFCPLYGPVEENTRFQLEAARANVAAAQAGLDEARAGATPAEQFLANSGVSLAIAQRDQAQAQLDLVLAGARDEQIRQAEVGVAQAELGVEQAQVQVTQAQSAVIQADAGIVKAMADLEAAQKALDRMTLTAPFAGRVGDINLEIGELVAPGVPIMQFGDFSSWLVKTTDLTELDVVAVKNGLPVEIRIDALPGEVIEGIVTDIASVSQVTRGDVTYEVSIELADIAALPLRWGMTAFADIETN